MGKFQVLFFQTFWTPGIHALGSLKLFPQLTVLQFLYFSLCFILDRYYCCAFKFISLFSLLFHPVYFSSHTSQFSSLKVFVFFISFTSLLVNFLNLWNTFTMLFRCSCQPILTSVPALGWFQLVIIPAVHVFLPVCLVIFNWMPDVSDVTLLGEVFWIPRSILERALFSDAVNFIGNSL